MRARSDVHYWYFSPSRMMFRDGDDDKKDGKDTDPTGPSELDTPEGLGTILGEEHDDDVNSKRL